MLLVQCAECGRDVEGGLDACQRDFDALQGRTMVEPSAYGIHRLMVDAYSLQHAERYCRSAVSYAAHLTGMLAAMEHESRPEVLRALQAWLSTRPALDRPALPDSRGEVTIADVLVAPDRLALDRAIRSWGESVWAAYGPWHALARSWTTRASGQR